MGAYYIDLPVFQRVYPIKLAENDVIVYEYLELHIFNPCRLRADCLYRHAAAHCSTLMKYWNAYKQNHNAGLEFVFWSFTPIIISSLKSLSPKCFKLLSITDISPGSNNIGSYIFPPFPKMSSCRYERIRRKQHGPSNDSRKVILLFLRKRIGKWRNLFFTSRNCRKRMPA